MERNPPPASPRLAQLNVPLSTLRLQPEASAQHFLVGWRMEEGYRGDVWFLWPSMSTLTHSTPPPDPLREAGVSTGGGRLPGEGLQRGRMMLGEPPAPFIIVRRVPDRDTGDPAAR